jgi:iron complex outermembrane recepter protein
VNIHRSVGLFLAGTCGLAAAAPAHAQNSNTTAANSQPLPAQVQTDQNEIIVTAQKRPQVLIDVPQSVTVVTGGTLEQQHATNFQDYLKLIPGLQLSQDTPGEGRLIIRGLNTGGIASTVSVYVDESPFGSSTGLVNGAVLAADFDTFDLNRIEVLRGPQGTLYGASSLGGVLRFVTNAPSTAGIEARARVGLQDVDNGGVGALLNAMINVPITSTIAFRASGSYRKDPGFINSIGTSGPDAFGNILTADIAKGINDDRVFGGRASLLFKPSSAATIRLTAIAQNIDSDEPTVIEADPVTLRPVHGLVESQFVPQFSNLHYRLYNATGTFDLGFANLTTSTSYSKQDQRLRNDLTFALSGLIALFIGPNEFIEPQETNLTKFTEEVRLAGQTHFADWLVGGYYSHEKGFIQQDLTAVEPGTLTPIDVIPVFGIPLAHLELPSKYKEIAAFADATVHLTQQFDLQFGGRYSKNDQSSRQTVVSALLGSSDDFGSSSEHVFTYSVAPKYKLNQNTTIYARVAKGFRPGGPNAIAPDAPADLRTFHSDSAVSWEAGVKAQTPDHLFSVDAAAFHINWRNIQLFTTFVVNNVPFTVNSNGPSAKSDGVELTATARPLPGLDLSLNGAYTNARLTGDTPADVGGLKGDQLPFTPKLSFAMNADYHWQLSSGVRARVGGSYRHLSGQKSDFQAGTSQLNIRPYGVFDLNAGLDFGRFNLDAYVKNLGNSHGITSVVGTATPIFPNGAIGTGIIRPRTIGLSLGFNY